MPEAAQGPFRILLVDDHPVVRQGIVRLLEEALAADILEADSARVARHHLGSERVDLVVLDLGLPDRPGLEVLKDLKVEYPDLPVMILSVSCPDQVALRAIRSGAAAYLAKDCPPDELVRAVRTVLERGHYLTRDVSELLLEHTQRPGDERTGHQRLSDREYQILLALGRGETQRAIADRERISPKTVSTYRTRILEKLALRTTADLVRYCLENRLLDADSVAHDP